MSQQNNEWQPQGAQDQGRKSAGQQQPAGGAAWQAAGQSQPGFQAPAWQDPQAGWQGGYAPNQGFGYGQPYGYGPAQGFGWAPVTAEPAPQKKSRAWIVALVAVVLVFLLFAMGMHSCSSMMTASMGLGSDSVSEADAPTQDAVAVVTIGGDIQYDGTSCSPEGLKALLDEAEANPYIQAVVLRVDSGGGVATAGEEMTEYLKQFGKPVVVSSASMNASAAYEISSQADYIFTARTTAIGAIGTAIQITDTSELMDKLGINIENITSSESKDSSYGTRPLTDEERAYYQDMVDQINDTFIQNVAEGRGMDVDEVRALATGLTFTGMDAVENGLADEIGTKEDAIAKAAELAGLSNYTVVSLDQGGDDLTMLLDLLSESDVSAKELTDALENALNEEGEGSLER